MVQDEKHIDKFFEQTEHIQSLFKNKEPIIFLDYDGTLTPIVATPDLAVLSEEMRLTVKELAAKVKVSIVSGRATDDVQSKVKLDGLFYAGSHGFEIVDPHGNVKINQEAEAVCSTIVEVYHKLSEKVKEIEGSLVEDVKYTISCHYRLVKEEDVPKIKQAVDDILVEYRSLRVTHGKKVFELRPKIDWHKGKAVEWILDVIGFDPNKHVVVYIGDDTTDEDAFTAIDAKGFGILVAEDIRPTEAKYWINNTHDVKGVLEYFIKLTNVDEK